MNGIIHIIKFDRANNRVLVRSWAGSDRTHTRWVKMDKFIIQW